MSSDGPLPDAPAPTATPPAGAPATPAARSLADAVHEIERHVSGAGWDGPVRVFALVGTARAMAA